MKFWHAHLPLTLSLLTIFGCASPSTQHFWGNVFDITQNQKTRSKYIKKMHISFINNHDGSNNSNVPMHANLAGSKVRGTSPTKSSATQQYIAASWGMRSLACNNIVLRRSESVKDLNKRFFFLTLWKTLSEINFTQSKLNCSKKILMVNN